MEIEADKSSAINIAEECDFHYVWNNYLRKPFKDNVVYIENISQLSSVIHFIH